MDSPTEPTPEQRASEQKATQNTLLVLTSQKLGIMRRRSAHKKANGIYYYKPHAKQTKFHEAGWAKRRYVRTGNRWGKTTAGTAENISWCRGERVWLPEGSPERKIGIPQRAVKGILLVQDWSMVKKLFTNMEDGPLRGKIFKLLPYDWYADDGVIEKDGQGNVVAIKIKSIYGGLSTIFINTVKSFLSNPQSHESMDYDFVHIDEPIPEEMWEAYSRGLVDRGGSAWFLCTPITEMWINDYFFPEGEIRSVYDKGLDMRKESKWLITGSMTDNDHMSREDIEQFKADIPKESWAARIDGKPKALAGCIYTQFDHNVHLYQGIPFGWKGHNLPPHNYTIRLAIDPHPSTPNAVLFAATSPFGVTYFYYELWDRCHSGMLARQVLHAIGAYRPEAIICDPIAFNEQPSDGRTMADDFDLEGLTVQKAGKDLSRGILNTQMKLDERDTQGNPVLMFSPTLTKTLSEFDRYVFDPKTGKPSKTCSDHMMENLYRLVNHGLSYVAPEKMGDFKPAALKLPTVSLSAAKRSMASLHKKSKPSEYLLGQSRYIPRYGSQN